MQKKRLLFLIKTIATACFINFTAGLTNAQTIDWRWAKGSTGTGDEEGWCVAADKSCNVYIGGSYAGSIAFGGTTLPAATVSSAFLAKYDSSGNVLWATSSGAGDLTQATGVVTDVNNNVYLTGQFSGDSIVFGNTVLYNSSGNYSVFLAKYDSNGNVLWAQSAVGSEWARAYGIAIDPDGHVCITGSFQSSLLIGAFNLGGNALRSAPFIAKYDTNGNVLWANTAVSNENCNSLSAATDPEDNVYITGYFEATSCAFGGTTLNGSNGGIFVTKYNSAGAVVWAKNTGTGGTEQGAGIATDQNNNVYITGFFNGAPINFGCSTLNNHGNISAFVAKYDSLGNPLWAQLIAGTRSGQGYNISAQANGVTYATGGFSGSSVTVAGDTLSIPYDTIDPMYFVSFDPYGNLLCAQAFVSGGDDQNAVCLDLAGNAYLGGDFESNEFIVGDDTVPLTDGHGNENVFIAKFRCNDGPIVNHNFNYTVSPASICFGDSALITFTGGSGLTISPDSHVTWLDSAHALLHPDTSTLFTISGYTYCDAPNMETFTLPVFFARDIHITTSQLYLCPDQSGQICVNPGFSYIWSNGDTTACIYTTTPGNYSVTASDNNRCTAVCNHALIAYSPPPFMVNVTGDTLSYNQGNNYQWLLNGNPIAGATYPAYVMQGAGTYTLQLTDTAGCTVISDPVVTGTEQLKVDGFSVYPNPSTAAWTLMAGPDILGELAEVFDAEGNLVYSHEIKTLPYQIELLAARGVYTLKISGQGTTVVKKLVKL